jgi:hypothetical protein
VSALPPVTAATAARWRVWYGPLATFCTAEPQEPFGLRTREVVTELHFEACYHTISSKKLNADLIV